LIFDDKMLAEITNQEIEELVKEHIQENQNLEFKLTLNYKSEPERFETLCDIVSLANAGGGYLVIGIREDGKSRALRLENVDNIESMIKSIRSLCLEHIEERIEGMEFDTRIINGCNIAIIRVPVSSRIPHMVTLNNHTHFVTRYADGKREMTLSEIRSSFTQDVHGRRLSFIEEGIKSILNIRQDEDKKELINMLVNEELSPISITDGRVLNEGLTKYFLKSIDKAPYFRIAIVPITTGRNIINVDSTEIRDVFQNPPNQRQGGWNMENFYSSIERFPEGIYRGDKKDRMLILYQNGYMEFYAPLDMSYCWRQSQEEFKRQPRLYPYPVVEYPLSFLDLYSHIVRISNIETKLIISMQYLNCKGYTLLPYKPESIGFYMPRNSPKVIDKDHLIIPNMDVNYDFDPNLVCYELLKYFYAVFSYTPDMIPFFIDDKSVFIME